jgi:hypothetical protein
MCEFTHVTKGNGGTYTEKSPTIPTTSFLTATILLNKSGAGITATAGTWLALHLHL